MAGIRMTGLISNMDTESIVTQLMEAQRTKVTKIQNKKTKLEWSQDKWKDFNTKLYKLYQDQTSNLRLVGNYSTKKATSADESIAKITAENSATVGTHKVAIKQLASSQYVTSGQFAVGTTTGSKLTTALGMTAGTVIEIKSGIDSTTGEAKKSKSFTVTEDSTLNDFIKACNDAGLKASYDKTQRRLFINSESSGANQKFTITASSDNVLAGLKLTNITGDATTDSTSGMNVVAAADCKAIYNGVELTSTTNTISANGLKIEAVGVSDKVGSDYKETSITISNDSDAVYKKVKDFITQYNSILKELNDAYYADSARGYDPLTDEEKEAMTDDQIKMWEDKIKKSLLRRDSTLGSLTTAMKTAMSSTVKVNGTTYSLASFGIMTSTDYTEKGLLHIYGDKEDSTYSDKDDKLKAAIEADPDAFAEAFSGIVKNLHDTLYKKMAKTSISSALTFYNDKTIKNQISSYEKNISTLENKLSDMENRYYKQFSAMETALAKLQSQQSALSGLLGTS